MKIIKTIILSIILLLSFWALNVSADLFDVKINTGSPDNNLNTWNKKAANDKTNEHLDQYKTWDSELFDISTWWEKWISQTLFNIAKDLKNIFFMLASIFLIILVLKLVFTDNTDEEVWKFKKWIIWISIWIIVTQIAYSFVKILYDNDINSWLANNFIDDIIYPLIKLLQTWASFFFLGIAIFAFFRIITANWEEEVAKSWKMSILYWIIWFIIIKVSRIIVYTIYWKVDCNNHSIWWIIEVSNSNCVIRENIDWSVKLLADIINWANSFIFIIITILIIYTWAQVILSAWDEEVLKKAKNSIIYIVLWLFLLFVNYLILTFFIIPESII